MRVVTKCHRRRRTRPDPGRGWLRTSRPGRRRCPGRALGSARDLPPVHRWRGGLRGVSPPRSASTRASAARPLASSASSVGQVSNGYSSYKPIWGSTRWRRAPVPHPLGPCAQSVRGHSGAVRRPADSDSSPGHRVRGLMNLEVRTRPAGVRKFVLSVPPIIARSQPS